MQCTLVDYKRSQKSLKIQHLDTCIMHCTLVDYKRSQKKMDCLEKGSEGMTERDLRQLGQELGQKGANICSSFYKLEIDVFDFET